MEQPVSGAVKSFGKYQLIDKLGEGGFGEVLKAYDTQNKRYVALKVLHQGLMSDISFIKKAKIEAEFIGKLDHPNIVKVYEVNEIAGRLCIAMEYIDGKPLSGLLKSGQHYNIPQILNIITQIASALDATHAKKIIHRDVKPDNILVDTSGNIHLVDFGLAHAALSSLGQSSKLGGVGSARYMSPEQAAGKLSGPAADIYSLAIIAYELFTGKVPFEADTLMGYMNAHQNQKPPDPIKLNPSISREAQKVILKGLGKNPGDRYKSAGEFARMLNRAMGIQTSSHKFPWAVAVVVILLFLCGASMGGLFLFSGSPVLDSLTTIFKPPAQGTRISALLTPDVTSTLKSTDSPTATTLPPVAPAEVTNAAAGVKPALPTPAPGVVAAPTVQASPTSQPAPMPAAGEQTVLVGSGVKIDMSQGSNGSGTGKLIFSLRDGDGKPVAQKYFCIYSQKKDLSGKWVVDQRINCDGTDNTGSKGFDLDPAHYIVQSDLDGYNWGTSGDVKGQADVIVESGRTTQVTLSLSKLLVGFIRGDMSVISNKYVQVYTQKKDLANNWVMGDRVDSGNTDNSGAISFMLTPGYYIVSSDLPGYNWGNEVDAKGVTNVALQPGRSIQVVVGLGQLVVGLVDAGGQPLSNKYVKVSTQKKDASGKPSIKESVDSGNTDNSGQAIFNLTPGDYAVEVGDQVIYNVSVISGKITTTNGSTFKVQ